MRIRLRRPTVTQALVGVFLPLVSGTGLLVAWIDAQRMGQMITSASEDLVRARADRLRSSWARQVDPVKQMLELQVVQEAVPAPPPASRWRSLLPRFQQILARHPLVTAYNLGWQDGSLFRVVRVMQFDGRRLPGLPPRAAYLVETLDRRQGVPLARREAFDNALRSLGPLPVPEQLRDYDVTQAPWFRSAQRARGEMVISPPQMLKLTGGLGFTLSTSADGRSVAVAVVLAANLDSVLQRFRITPGTELAVVDDKARLLLSPGRDDDADRMLPLGRSRIPGLAAMEPQLRQLMGSADPFRQQPRLRAFRAGRRSWYGAVVGIQDPQTRSGNYLLMAVPAEQLLADARKALRAAEFTTLLVVLFSAPLVLLLAMRIARPLKQLAQQAARIRHFDFDSRPAVGSLLREVNDLGSTVQGMRHTIRSFLQSSAALGAEPDVELLLQRLLDDAIEASGARSGVLYRADASEPDNQLKPLLQHDHGSDAPSLQSLPPLAPDALEQVGDSNALVLPLRSRDGGLQGALALRFDQPPEDARVAFCRALSGSAAVALETRSLIAAQKALFEAFVQLLADAIDAKSPYTGGHCARVPALARALAEAACDAKEGPFAAFELTDRDWEALHLAAWLHDCGKVTTPEFVVDKATKLETLYDRIHEVRMRFELLKAEAETAYWRGVAEGGDPDALRQARDRIWADLDADFAFVAACNQGGERMEPEQIQRLERIASRRWRRTLDDRLGISADERRRCAGEAEVSLPVLEPLLSDRTRHRIERLPQQRLPSDNPWGFTMREPELLYNRGELANLCISRGTLSEEERYKINEHIIHTIRMLEALPFPAHLRDVPEIAGGHHERMDGNGYPRSLSAEQMSPLARVMAIADVFEALTASDRPYKSGKPLSAALAIMAAMVRDHHLDPELFELFLRSGACRRYAEDHLAEDQCDPVDVEAVLAASRPGNA
jgi:HD-GYP domain-containing protein (c-di-GMP phosphodiesterase class II)